MTILADTRPAVQPTTDLSCTLDHAPAFVPTAEDLDDYGRWLASRADLQPQAAEPVPVELLVAPAGAEDLEDDGEPWWSSLPTDPALDSPIGLGPDAGPVAVKVRGERYAVELAGRPERPADGYAIRDRVTNLVCRRARWFVDAERMAAELNRNAIRAAASRFSPEADAFGCC